MKPEIVKNCFVYKVLGAALLAGGSALEERQAGRQRLRATATQRGCVCRLGVVMLLRSVASCIVSPI